MCGLTGYAGKDSKTNGDVFNTLLVLDSLRGIDSTGVAAIPNVGEPMIVKEVGSPYQLMDSKSYDKALTKVNRAVIGHNRATTSGGTSRKNAHPFENDTLIGAHNGTLIGKHRLLDSSKFQVDSENLYYHIDQKGLKDALSQAQGAWSLVWWDKQLDTLNFLRNNQRPMFKTWSLDHSTLFWASEAWMLSIALSRVGVKHTDIVETEVDKHYSYHISQGGVISKPYLTDAPGTYWEPQTQSKWSGYQYQQQQKPQRAVNYGENSKKDIPEGNVVDLTKKLLEVKNTTPDLTYQHDTLVFLEILEKTTDQYGAPYYVCFDDKNPSVSIRLYTSHKETDKTGALIECNISGVRYSEKQGNLHVSYYKVVHSSVKMIEDGVTDAVEYFIDSKGNKLDATSWDVRHGECACCTGVVNPRFDFRFTTDGSAICHECVSDIAVSKYISFVK